jgi:acetolactate synthase I/II/III large subunit
LVGYDAFRAWPALQGECVVNVHEKPVQTETPIDSVGDAIVAAMQAGGVDHLFFTSGSEIGFYQEAIAKSRAHGHNNPMRLVTVPLEHVSLNAALGFAAVSGRPAATAAHVDCGTLHYGGAIHTAWRSSLPVIMTAGFPPTAASGTMNGARDEGGHLWMQEVFDQNGIVRNYTKWSHQLAYQDNPGVIASRAIQVARSEPCGPVYLTVPKELSLLPVRDARFPSADQLGIPRPAAPNMQSVAELTERLIGAKNPVVVVSGSGRNTESVPALVSLCETLGLAVVDSASKAYLSFPYDHPLFQGATALKDADVVLVLEADIPWVPGRNSPPEGAYIAVVAHDPVRLRFPIYEFTAQLRIASDPLLSIHAIAAAAEATLTAKDKARIAERSARLGKASDKRYADYEAAAKAQATTTPIDPSWASYLLTQALDDNCILLDDTLGGNPVQHYLRNSWPGSYFKGAGSSGGWAPGAAFGAKLAAPDRDVVAVTGDGFYMFGTPGPALWAGAHHNAPFMVVVNTNRSYTTGTTALYRAFGRDSYAAKQGFEGGYFDPPIDFAKEAEAAGAYGENVRDPSELAGAYKRGLDAIRGGKPAVISIWQKRLEGDD